MKSLLLIPIAFIIASCSSGPHVNNGLIYAGQKGPITVEDAGKGNDLKKGQACATNVLGIISLGDNSIATAKRNGKLTNVSYADYETSSILGIYTSVCTNVVGN